MCIKIKTFVLFLFLCFFSIAVNAAVERKNTVVFFLPVQKYEEITTVREAVPSVMPKGDPKEMSVEDELKKNPDHVKHGIPTKVGVSLYDKGGVPLEQATENIIMPAKVLILPPEDLINQKAGKGKNYAPESVWPYKLRVFPLIELSGEIKKEAKENPVITRYPRLLPPKDPRKIRPKDVEDWTDWALGELKNCNMDAQTVLPTLYWLSQNKKLSDDRSVCDIKKEIAAFLRKCHPWPVVYYTPVNNDVPVRPPVQMAAEYLETDFDNPFCPVLDLSGVNFERVEFIQGRLKNADFSKSYLHEATFLNTDLSDSVFSEAVLDNVLFQDSDLPAAVFKKARMKYAYIYKADASGTVFDGADMQNTQFRDVNFSRSRFPDAVLQNTRWKDVKAYRMYAPRADFAESGFDNVLMWQLQAGKSDFRNITCKNCVWKTSFLEYAYFRGGIFENTSFDGSKLSYSDFSSAFLGKGVSFADAVLYKTNFSGSDLKQAEGVSIDKMMHTKIDKKTVPPETLGKYDAETYDTEFDGGKKEKKKDKYSCSLQACSDRLLGRVNNHNLAVRAMTILSDAAGKTDDQIWALCTIGCIARHDKKLETSQVDTLAAFVKRNRRWDAENDLFRPYTPFPPEAQMALFILTDPQIERDLGRDVDLTGTDLRTADLSYGDLRDINFAGSHLGGANLSGSLIDLPVRRFDQVVIDEFTRMPSGMRGAFKQFELPDSIVPPWWKPETVRIYRDGTHLWTVTTEDVPFSDDMIIHKKSEKMK